MKRVFSLIMVCMLCLSMFMIFAPKASASSDLLSLPAAPYGWQYSESSHNTLMVNPLAGPLVSVSEQSISASPGQTVTVSVTYQVFSQSPPNNPSEIDQLFFVESWTTSWPPQGYTVPLYNGIPGLSPGVTQTNTISFTVPSVSGTYYLWLCFEAQYSMQDAVNQRTQSMSGLPGHIKIVVSTLQSDLLSLPAAPYGWQYSESSHNTLMVNPLAGPLVSVSEQSISASPGQTVTVSVTYQVFSQSPPNNPSEIDQLFLVESWTPTWPPRGYTIPLYNGIPGLNPGVTQTNTISFTVPIVSGTYYLWLCFEAQYSMQDAVNQRTRSMTGLPGHIKIVVTPPSAPVGYWKFDEGSGTVARDSSGNGNDGTVVGASWTNGVSGGALQFDGIDDCVGVSSLPSICVTGSQISVQLWMKPAVTLDANTPITNILDKGDEYGFQMDQSSSGRIWFFVWLNGAPWQGIQTTTSLWQADTWYLLTGTYDGSNLKVYVNGFLENSRPLSSDLSTSGFPLAIGSYCLGSKNFFNGVIDEVKIYNYARTAQEIQNDYVSAQQPDFEISASPDNYVASPGFVSSFVVTVASINGFNSAVHLGAFNIGSELTAQFESAIVTPPPGGSVFTTLQVSVLSTYMTTYNMIIEGTSGQTSHSSTINLQVPFMSIPYLSQGDVNWCLPTSVAMICRFYGRAVHQADAAYGIGEDHSGSSFPIPGYTDKVKDYVTALGLQYEQGAEWNRANVAAMLGRGLPIVLTIISKQWSGFPPKPNLFHSVVVTGFDADTDTLFINDPSGALGSYFAGTNPHMPYMQITVKFSDLDAMLKIVWNVDSWFGLDGDAHPVVGSLNIIGGDSTEYKTVSVSHGGYQPWTDDLSIFWSGDGSGSTNGLTWSDSRALSPDDYLAIFTPAGGLYDYHPPIINPTDIVRNYQFEVTFNKDGIVKGTTGKLSMSSVIACSMVNSPLTRQSPLRIGNVISESGQYVIGIKLYDSMGSLIDSLDLPAKQFSSRVSYTKLYCPADLFITDAAGRSTGVDPITKQVVNNIPNAFYSGPGTEPETIVIPDPMNNTYNVVLVGTDNGNYTLTMEYIAGTQTTMQSFYGTIAPQEVKYYSDVISSTGTMTLISWEYVFKDARRGTMLKISTDDKYFQFTAPGKDFGIKQDQKMKVFNHVIAICFEDSQMSLIAAAVDSKISSCSAVVWDKQTHKCYLLIAVPNLRICGSRGIYSDIDFFF